MLAVGIQRDDVRGAARARRRHARAQRLRLAAPPPMTANVGAGERRRLRGPVGRAVVHHDDRCVPARAAHDVADRGGLIVRGDDDERVHAASTSNATWAPPRASPCTSPRPGRTRATCAVPFTTGSRPERAVHAAAATRSTPNPA